MGFGFRVYRVFRVLGFIGFWVLGLGFLGLGFRVLQDVLEEVGYGF